MRWRSADRILKDREIVVDIPHGDAWLRDDEERPLTLIVKRCTGFLRALHPLTALAQTLARDVTIYRREESTL